MIDENKDYSKINIDREARAKALHIGGVVVRFFKWVAIIIISLNMGAFLGKMTFKLILWTGLLPYLEKFFSWIVW